MRSKLLAAALVVSLPGSLTAASVYSVDDGSGESGFGGFGVTFYWLNAFTSVMGSEFIDTVQVSFGANGADPATYNGKAITVCIWSDPDDDGIPDDAVLEASMPGVISGFVNTGVTTATNFVDFNFASSVEIPAGERFFVGIGYYFANNVFGPARDTATNEGKSFAYRWNSDNPTAASNMASADVKQNFDEVFGGNAMVRAVGQAVPEPSAVMLGALGLLAGVSVRRRSR